jgi:predicted thioesterase
VQSGLVAFVDLTVTDEDTALALRSGDVPVLGTPRIVALVEEASVKAVCPSLGDGQTTVGMRIELSHLIPVAVGKTVRAEATLERVEGRRLTFTVSVNGDQGLVAVGKLTRVVVDREQFLEKAG